MRRKARTDSNQKRIVTALRAAGRFVFITSGVGHGFPDLLVVNPHTGNIWLVEVKDPEKKVRLTEHQKAFWREWPLPNLHIVTSIEEALTITSE